MLVSVNPLFEAQQAEQQTCKGRRKVRTFSVVAKKDKIIMRRNKA